MGTDDQSKKGVKHNDDEEDDDGHDVGWLEEVRKSEEGEGEH